MLLSNTDRDLRRMEEDANDELLLLDRIGPSAFDDRSLLGLRDAAQLRINLLDRSIRLIRTIAAAFLGWLPIMVAAMWFQRSWLVKLGMLGMGAVILAFLVSLYFWVQQSRHRNEVDNIRRDINSELHRRIAGKASKHNT